MANGDHTKKVLVQFAVSNLIVSLDILESTHQKTALKVSVQCVSNLFFINIRVFVKFAGGNCISRFK